MRLDATASAPGKLFLFGEYSVLAGSWAVVTAVDRRVRATVTPNQGAYHVLGAQLNHDTRLPQAVLDEVNQAFGAALSPSQLTTDVRTFFEGAAKLGLGSSAASSAAIAAAGCAALDRATDAGTLFDLTFAAHHALQGGRGSGADVAASCFGGLLGYRLREPDPRLRHLQVAAPARPEQRLERASICRLRWPDQLRAWAVWLGTPARSVSFIDQLTAAASRAPAATHALLDDLGHISAEASRSLRDDDAHLAILDLVDRADDALEHLGEHIGAPIIIDAHRDLRTQARRFGVKTKPSGAGGGDFSLVIGARGADWRGLRDALKGRLVLDLGPMRVPGAHVDTKMPPLAEG